MSYIALRQAQDIAFDLEGPLSPQDNAYDLMGLFSGGRQVFEVLSRYDDLLTLEGRAGYEPGDTLALIVPFLLCHGVSEADIAALGDRATLVAGAPDLVARLLGEAWHVFCITTTYEQYASRVAGRVGIPRSDVACTPFSLDAFRGRLDQQDAARVKSIEAELARLVPQVDDDAIKKKLDAFYWQELTASPLGTAMAQVKPVGGRRKVAALEAFAGNHGRSLADFAVVGDSITDARMLASVNAAGGLAVAFNANEYALPEATMGLASTHLSDLWPALDAWRRGGRQAVADFVAEGQGLDAASDRNNFQWLAAGVAEADLLLHQRLRRLVRHSAAKLG